MTQMQGEGGQDALNFPGRMDNQLLALYGAIVGQNGGWVRRSSNATRT
jgi:hypothetical protein